MMRKPLGGLGFLVLGLGALIATAAAQTAPPTPPAAVPASPAPDQAISSSNPNPVCARLEGQLANLNRGVADPTHADQFKRYEDTIAKQQADLDRVLAQSKRQGCEGGGFFALFTGRSPQCQPLIAQIQQMRDSLDRTMSDFEQFKSGTSDQDGQRRAVIGQLAQANCGAQYRAAAAASGLAGFFGALFSGRIISGSDGAPSGTYRTVCVRTCDGYYFPISYATVPNRFLDDQRACQRQCPATDAQLYSYRNPGEDINQAVALGGQPYTELPTAFRYRKEYTASCSCRHAGQSWADALKNADDSSTLESGDIVVTDKNAKALSQAPQPKGAKPPLKPGAQTRDANVAPATADTVPATPGAVRTVGPPFIAAH